MTRIVVIAVAIIAAVATADAVRPEARDARVGTEAPAAAPLVVHHSSAGLLAIGSLTRKTVLQNGRAYLSEEEVDDAFPAGSERAPFDIAYAANGPDGIVALAVYKFPESQPARSAIEIWRGHRLVTSFEVPSGAFAGGLGFAAEGRLIAALSSDGLLVHLFTRRGRPAGRQPATSW
jgi:hypothetical protein